MKRRYYLSMLGLFPLILVFDAIYIPAHKSVEMFLGLAAVHLVLFGILNYFGARLLYKPIALAEENKMVKAQAGRRIQRLPWLSASWIFMLGATYFGLMLLMVYFSPLDTGDISLEEMPAVLWLTAIPSMLYIYALLPAFITWFVINDFTIDLKSKFFTEENFGFPPGKRRIGLMLLFTFIVLGFFPSVLVTLELVASGAGEEYAQFSEMTPLEAILPDRAIVFIGMIFAVVFITRSFTKPIHALLHAIEKVKAGDFSASAAITTEDEIGVLTGEFNEMVKGLKERELIRDTFGKYVTEDVANLVLSKKLNVAGEVRPCTILVTDIANYTTISEELTPQEIVAMLNEYFSVLVNVIQKHKGVVNKFIGDAVFAMFNVPLDDPNHASNAVSAALEIDEITGSKKFGKGRTLTTRIGINTGMVVAGNIGSADRLEYTVIGDDVNIAARLEQLNKQYNSRILAGENTYELTKNQFDFTEIGACYLKGKEKSIKVYKAG